MMNRESPKTAMSIIAFPADLDAFLSLPAPSSSEKFEAPPMPSSREMAVHVVDSGNAILVAAFPSMPTPCPMNIWSTILYSEISFCLQLCQGTRDIAWAAVSSLENTVLGDARIVADPQNIEILAAVDIEFSQLLIQIAAVAPVQDRSPFK